MPSLTKTAIVEADRPTVLARLRALADEATAPVDGVPGIAEFDCTVEQPSADRVVLTGSTRFMSFRSDTTVGIHGHGSEVTSTMELRLRGPVRLIAPLVSRSLRRVADESLTELLTDLGRSDTPT